MAMQELNNNEVQEVSGGFFFGWPFNGQLMAYAYGVLGDVAASQAILNSVDTSNMVGTTTVWAPTPAPAPAPAPTEYYIDNSWAP